MVRKSAYKCSEGNLSLERTALRMSRLKYEMEKMGWSPPHRQAPIKRKQVEANQPRHVFDRSGAASARYSPALHWGRRGRRVDILGPMWMMVVTGHLPHWRALLFEYMNNLSQILSKGTTPEHGQCL